MNLRIAIRKLRSEKQWFDEVIASVEEFRRSRHFQAVALLDLHLARQGRFDRRSLSPGSRRRLSRWLREAGAGNSHGPAARSSAPVA